MAQADEPAASRLERRLGLTDAVVLGLGSMLGAGVFAAAGPAAAAAGPGLLLGLVVAALVAYCNAGSSAALAARFPRSGGAYVYGRERLGHVWGYLAGWSFVAGKLASCAAMALTFATYAAPGLARPLAAAAVVALAAVNYRGVTRTAALTRVVVTLVVSVLALVVGAALAGGEPDAGRLAPLTGTGTRGVLEAGALLFFAFAGYARIATLGEEVADPERTIPRAIPLALGIVLVVYAAVLGSALLVAGAPALAAAAAPLAVVAEVSGAGGLVPLVRLAAAAASLGVLVALLAGVGRTVFAMAADGELPRGLGAVHPRFRVPHRAELAVAVAVVAAVAVADLRDAIGFSSFLVLLYYTVANSAAVTLSAASGWVRARAVVGIAGCVVLATALPPATLLTGVAVLAVGVAARLVRQLRHRAG